MKPELILQSPLWYVLICVFVAIVFAVFTYLKEKNYKASPKYLLAATRGLITFILCFLLLGPLVKYVSQLIIKPKVLILVDNSRSMNALGNKAFVELKNGLTALSDYLQENDFDYEVKTLKSDDVFKDFEKIKFQLNTTNLSETFTDIKNNYEGQNISDVILVSDGIINQGVSPSFQKYPFNVHTIGYGDTNSRKDLSINGIAANKIAYLGNKFLVNVDINSTLLKGKSTIVNIKNGQGKILQSKNIIISQTDDFQTISFELQAEKEGKQRYIVEAKALEGEYSLKNNVKDFLIDVVNGKEKILLVAYAPHPDIKAIKSIVEKNDLFELKVVIAQNVTANQIPKEPFDLLILHQLPDMYGSNIQLVNALIAQKKPTLFFVGSRTNLQVLNGMQNVMGINAQINKIDKVTGLINSSFNRFNLPENANELIAKLPPLNSPFGEYKTFSGSEIIMYQRFSGINTERPLLAYNGNLDRKNAVFVGEGLWQWRLEEFSIDSRQFVIDDFFIKTLQLLTIKEDKSKLRVYPLNEKFELDQKIVFEAEAYNNIFEKIYNQSISLSIKSENGTVKNYGFTNTPETSRFELSNLSAGLYSYTATAEILGKKETATGQFMVSNSDIETINVKADFDLLKTLSNENNGDYVYYKNVIELRNSLKSKGLINKVVSNEEMKDLVSLKWILFLLIALASFEWSYRKFLGGY